MGDIIFPLKIDENHLRDIICGNKTDEIRYVLNRITNCGQAIDLSVDNLASLSLMLEIASMQDGGMLLKEEIGKMLVDYAAPYVSLDDFLFFFLGRCRYFGRFDKLPSQSILATLSTEGKIRKYDKAFGAEIATLDRTQFMSYCHFIVEQVNNNECSIIYDPQIAIPIIRRIYDGGPTTIPRELTLLYMSINLSINS